MRFFFSFFVALLAGIETPLADVGIIGADSSVNYAPVANPQEISITDNTPKTITLSGDDFNGDVLIFNIVANPSHGTLSGLDPNTGVATYSPTVGFSGIDSFAFVVNDEIVDSDPAVVTVNLTPTSHTLTVIISGSGTVTSTPTGINCSPTCQASFTIGTSVTLSANPTTGYVFSGWSGDPDCLDGTVTLDANRICTATFELIPTITITTANGGETWPIGSTQAIRWTTSWAGGNVKVEISRNGGASWTTLISSTANDGVQNWKVTTPLTAQARIRICSVSVPSVCDTSDANFRIGGGSITVNVPNGGETWPIGSTQAIRWTTSWAGGNVKVELSRNGGTSWTTLISSTANDGAQNWKVTTPLTAQARIRICNVGDPSVCDTSNANFRIGGGSITVNVPNGGETWPIGSTQAIRWTTSWAGGNVKVELSRNGGTSWTTLLSSTANDGVQNRAVGGSATTQARIRVSNVGDPSVADTSNANFTIQ